MTTFDSTRQVPERLLRILIILTLTVLFILAPAGAETDFGARAGIYADAGDGFVGGEVLGKLGSRGWAYNPNFEWVFVDRGDLVTLNADFLYDFRVDEPLYLWLGGGPALIFRDNRRNDDTDFGLNLLAGVGFKTEGRVRPYVQAKIVLADDTEGVIAFGIRF